MHLIFLMYKKNITVIFLVTLIAVMGVASITPAFPSIQKQFGITPTQVTLLITVFTLPGIILSPVAGILADRFGRKTILLPSLFLFGIAGAACYFTNSWETLLVLRFFQGIGVSSLGSLNVTIIGDLFSGEKRGAVMGYNASVLSIGTASYPAIGGALAMVGWQIPFLLPLLAIPTGLMVILWLKNPEPTEQQNFKTYLQKTWKNIHKKTVWGLFIINISIFVVLYGSYLSYFPQMMVERLNANALQIGIFMSGISVVTAIVASQIKKINRKIKPKTQLNISFMLYLAAMVMFAFVNDWWQLFIPIIAFGLGHGMIIPGIQTLLVGFAPLNERAGFMSINNMVLRIGQTAGPIIIGLFYATGGTKFSFLGGAIVSLFMLLISLTMVNLKKQK